MELFWRRATFGETNLKELPLMELSLGKNLFWGMDQQGATFDGTYSGEVPSLEIYHRGATFGAT